MLNGEILTQHRPMSPHILYAIFVICIEMHTVKTPHNNTMILAPEESCTLNILKGKWNL